MTIGLTLGVVALGAAPAAAIQVLVGAETIRFQWAPAPGGPLGYLVSVSYSRGPLETVAWVTEPTAELAVEPGDQIAISVRGARRTSDGTMEMGPASPLSDQVWVVESPTFDASGQWTLHCGGCPAVSLRSLAHAPVRDGEAQGRPAPWQLVGRARLTSGSPSLVWHNPVSGRIDVWDAGSLRPEAGGLAPGPAVARYVGAADFDGDRVEEAVFFDMDRRRLALYGFTGGGFEKLAQILVPEGMEPTAVADFAGDRGIELLLHDPARGRLQLWETSGVRLGSLSAVSPSYLRQVHPGIPFGSSVATTGDFDDDGHRDLLLRDPRSAEAVFTVVYLRNGAIARLVPLPSLPGDRQWSVVGAVDVDGAPGDEVALQHRVTKELSLLVPRYEQVPLRIAVLHPGTAWSAVHVGP